MKKISKWSFILPLMSAISLFSCSVPEDFAWSSMNDIGAAVGYDDSGANAHLAAVGVCMSVSPYPESNRVRMTNTIRMIKAAHPDARLVLFPEIATGLYISPTGPSDYQVSIAEASSGTTFALLSAAAQSNGIYIGYGYTESSGGRIYNSFALVGPDGSLLANHRKVLFSPGMDDLDGFTPGTNATTAVIDGIKAGLSICMDSFSMKLLKAYGGDPSIRLILSPTTDTTDDRTPYYHDPRIRNVWYVSANRYGLEGAYFYDGNCGIFDPAGNARASTVGGEGYIYYNMGIYK